jgi:hypothetical protein
MTLTLSDQKTVFITTRGVQKQLLTTNIVRVVLADIVRGRAHNVALSSIPTLKSWKVHLCRHAEMVNDKKMAYLKGTSLADIHAEAFLCGIIREALTLLHLIFAIRQYQSISKIHSY